MSALPRDFVEQERSRMWERKQADPTWTGRPPGLLQDDDKKLSKWFASKPDARECVREVCREIERMDPYRRAEYDAGLDCDETPTERDEREERGASRWSEA